MTEDQIKHMANRFLMWKLPANFSPDGGINFERVASAGTPHEFIRQPVGTNLLGYTDAVEMVRHMIEGLPDSKVDNELATRSAIAAVMISGETH